jgi:hypothetical protein
MKERETMEEVMNQELNEAIATLNRANRALSRIFGIEEGENCSTCGKEKDQFSKEWEYSQCESCSMKEGEESND